MSEDVLAALRAGGVVEREGSFEVDAGKAREKMSQFQLQDPHLYVLEFVQAAHLLGATLIVLDQDADELELRFDGEVLEAAHLGELWTMALSRHRERRLRALRHLAIGINASAGLKPARLVVESGRGEAAHRLVVRPGEVEQVEAMALQQGASGTRIYLRESWRPGHLMEFWRGRRGLLEESQHVRARCLRSEVVIEVGGQRISTGKQAPKDSRYQRRFALGEDDGLVWLTGRVEDQRLHVLQHGVEVPLRVHPLPGLPVGWAAVVEGASLVKDLSQADFVRDEAWRVLMRDGLMEVLSELLLRWLKDHAGAAEAREERDATRRALILFLIGHYVAEQPTRLLTLSDERLGKRVALGSAPLGTHYNALWLYLCAQPVWRCDEAGQPVVLSSSQIRGKLKEGVLEWAAPDHVERPARGLVLREGEETAKQLASTMRARAESVNAAYEAEVERMVHLRRWRAQPVQRGITEGMCWATRRVASAAGEAHVGFRREQTKRGEATLVQRCQGRLVATQDVACELSGLVVVIDSAGELDRAGTGLAWSEELGQLWARALESAPAVLAESLEAAWAQGAQVAELELAATDVLEGDLDVSPRFVWERLVGRKVEEDKALTEIFYGAASFGRQLRALMAARDAAEYLRCVEGLGALGRVKLLGELEGEARGWSLRDIAGELTASGWVAVLSADQVQEGEALMRRLGLTRRVVVPRDAGQRRALPLLVPEARTRRWLDELKQEGARMAFLQRPQHRLALPEQPRWAGELGGRWLSRSAFAHPQIRGEIGMGLPGETHGIACHVLHEGREIMTLRLPCDWGRFEVVLTVVDATPNAAWDGLELPAAYGVDALERELRGLVRAQIEGWVHTLRLEELEADEQAALWSLSHAHHAHDLSLSARAERALEAMAFVEIGARRMTYKTLMKRIEETRGPVHYVLGDAEVMESLMEPGQPRSIVRLSSARLVSALERAAGARRALRDVSNTDARREELALRRVAFMARPEEGLMIKGALKRRELVDGEIKGHVGLMPDPHMRDKVGSARIDLLHEHRLVVSLDEPLPLGRFHVRMNVPDLRLDAEWGRVAHDYDLGPLKALAQEACWQVLIEACDEVKAAPRPLREQLGWYLKRACAPESPLAVRLAAVHDALVSMRLFERIGAHAASYDMLRTLGKPIRYVEGNQPVGGEATGALRAESWDDAQLIVALFPDATAIKAAPQAKPSPPPLPASGAAGAALAPAPEPTPTPAPSAPAPDRGAALTERVRAQLMEARGDHRVLLGDQWAGRLIATRRGGSLPVCAIRGGAVEVNVDHPACELAMRRGDAWTLAVVTAAVYGEINRVEEVITDAHERAYLARLAALVTMG